MDQPPKKISAAHVAVGFRKLLAESSSQRHILFIIHLDGQDDDDAVLLGHNGTMLLVPQLQHAGRRGLTNGLGAGLLRVQRRLLGRLIALENRTEKQVVAVLEKHRNQQNNAKTTLACFSVIIDWQ